MSKLTTVVEFDDKEIRDMLRDKAKEILGKQFQGSCEIAISGGTGDRDLASLNHISCRVTFNGKAER